MNGQSWFRLCFRESRDAETAGIVSRRAEVNDVGRVRLERAGVGVGMLDSRRRFSQR